MRRPGDLIVKDPDSTEPQGFDWTPYLTELDDEESLNSSEWDVSDTGLVLSGDAISADGKKTVVTLTGGDVGTIYTVTNRIQTSSGVVDDRSFRVYIEER